LNLCIFGALRRNVNVFVHFFKRSSVENVQNTFFLFLGVSGRGPETHSLFAKSEAKTLIRLLRILTQSAETTVSAGGVGAEPPQILCLHDLYTSAFEKSGGVRGGTLKKDIQSDDYF
jgi:hypothetical protein